MTCREKLAIEHPTLVNDIYCGGCADCPQDFNYISFDNCLCVKSRSELDGLSYKECTACWDQEVEEVKTEAPADSSEEKINTETHTTDPYQDTVDALHEGCEELGKIKKALVKNGFDDKQAFELIKLFIRESIERKD